MPGFDQHAIRAAYFDEILGPGFQTAVPANAQEGFAEERVSAWCKASADGDWELFRRRLAVDNWNTEFVEGRFHAVNLIAQTSSVWIDDARWILERLSCQQQRGRGGAFPFAGLFDAVVTAAGEQVVRSVGDVVGRDVSAAAFGDLQNMLLADLTGLCAPVLYERFAERGVPYAQFLAESDLVALMDEKPVLLRLIATMVRQWLDAVTEFLTRLVGDKHVIRELAAVGFDVQVAQIDGPLSDRHDGARAVLRVVLSSGHSIVYKPRDQGVAVAFNWLLDWLNDAGPPVILRAPAIVGRDGYGWSEFIEHRGCESKADVGMFFRRAGAWLALFHCLAATDMHHENLIASGDHPVPVDIECILQDHIRDTETAPEFAAAAAARAMVEDSVLAVGLLPGYARVSDGTLRSAGGLASGWSAGREIHWQELNSDCMRPVWRSKHDTNTNLPHIDGRYAELGNHLHEFRSGFTDYAAFLSVRDWTQLLGRFRGSTIRKVVRPTQFYQMLLDRLRDDRFMSDGVLWSVQADFLVRLVDWSRDPREHWAALAAQRAALLDLTVPLFMESSEPGIARSRERAASLDGDEIDWQLRLIEHTSSFNSAKHSGPIPRDVEVSLNFDDIDSAADDIADMIAEVAICRDGSAAWTGLRWYSDSDASQLAVLGHDMYGGATGVAVFLAAHAHTRNSRSSAELALAALARLRVELRGPNAARLARLLGVGGGAGMGSVVYALATIADILGDDSLLDDAFRAADLITSELISRDDVYDVMGGCAGAALGLLRLQRVNGSAHLLDRAQECGLHLVEARPPGSWRRPGVAHGAAGLALMMGYLAIATGREDFASMAHTYLSGDSGGCCSGGQAASQWCHGAAGSGLVRMTLEEVGMGAASTVSDELGHLLQHVMSDWPGRVDTLCCGSLGNIEALRMAKAEELCLKRLSTILVSGGHGDGYRWNGGDTRFNVGLFRGLAGVGYTALRAVDDTLPNVLIWE